MKDVDLVRTQFDHHMEYTIVNTRLISVEVTIDITGSTNVQYVHDRPSLCSMPSRHKTHVRFENGTMVAKGMVGGGQTVLLAVVRQLDPTKAWAVAARNVCQECSVGPELQHAKDVEADAIAEAARVCARPPSLSLFSASYPMFSSALHNTFCTP